MLKAKPVNVYVTKIPALVEEPNNVRFGVMRGEFTIAEDFNAAFSDDLQRAFETRLIDC